MKGVVELDSVADVFNGKTPAKQDQRPFGHPVLKIRDIDEEGRFRGPHESFVEPGFAEHFRERLVREGDTLILNAAHNADYVASKVALADAAVAGALATGEWLIIRPTGANARFVHYWIRSLSTRRALRKLVKGIHLYPKDVARLLLPMPHPTEQRRIAEILEKADTICRRRKEAIALTEELLRATFLTMVGPGAQNYATWPTGTVESLAAQAPNAMRTGPFGSDLLHSEFVSEGVAVLGIDNAVKNQFDWAERRFVTLEKYEKLRRYTVAPGDVIVTIMGTTGRSAVVPDGIPAAITTKHLATITLDRNKAEPEFVSQALFRHPEVLQQIAAANKGAIMNGLNLGLIKALRMPIPPLDTQRDFARASVRIRAMAVRMERQYDADALFESLVARFFSCASVAAC